MWRVPGFANRQARAAYEALHDTRNDRAASMRATAAAPLNREAGFQLRIRENTMHVLMSGVQNEALPNQ